jgi:hypothetical protein
MPIQFQCACGQQLQVQDQHAGARVRCPKCQRECTAPVPVQPVTAEAPPPPPKPSPVKASRDEDVVELPRESRRRAEEDDNDDRPRKSRRRDEEDEDDDDRPRKRKRSRRDDDDDDDDRDRPRRVVAQSSGLATASLILGLVSICFGALTGVPAIILGLIAFIKISGSKGRLTGTGKAVAGVTTGLIFSVLMIFGFFRVQEAKERIVDSNNLHQMGLGVMNYCDTNNGRLPGYDDSPDPFNPGVPGRKSQLSWRVHLLPYLEQDNLYRPFKLDEPWDSPTNKRLIPMMPKIYAHPKADPQWAQEGKTVYRVFTGPHCAFNLGARFPATIVDGTSNTIMVVESADPVIWTKPDEIEYDPKQPLPKFGHYFSGGYQVLMFDGSTRMISPSVSETTLRAAITSNGNDFLGPDW